jgi:hypothetical protein
MPRAFRALHDRLGDAAMSDLQLFVEDTGQQWRDDVIAAAERFDGRLRDETNALRIDMTKEFAAVRVDMAKEFAAVRREMATEFAAVQGEMAREFAAVRSEMAGGLASARADLLKWSFLFWVGQFAAVSGMMAFLLRTIR